MDAGTLAAIAAPVFAAVIGFLGGKKNEQAKTKKVEAETDSIITAAAEKAVEMWRSLNTELKVEVVALRGQVTALSTENAKLHQENMELKGLVKELREEVEQLKEKMS